MTFRQLLPLMLLFQGLAAIMSAQTGYQHPIPFAPETYVCYRTDKSLSIDGRLDEPSWQAAPWSRNFVDIEGSLKPVPPLRTRVKLLWDDRFLYIGAELTDPHLWATLRERDAVLFQDDDFEVFIDPDGDGWTYAELEINENNAIWDLLMAVPYHLHQPVAAISGWDIRGIQTAVHLDGTLNQAGDQDKGWSVEIAIPLASLQEITAGKALPVPGAKWRVNFSRVDWRLEAAGQGYRKVINPATGRPFPENNWVWSPTGRVDMHRPETWGVVQFSGVKAGQGSEAYQQDPAMPVQWALWQLFYAQREHFRNHGEYAQKIEQLAVLGVDWPGYRFEPELFTTPGRFQFTALDPTGKRWSITQDGRLEPR